MRKLDDLIYSLLALFLVCFSCKHSTQPDLLGQGPKIAFLHHISGNARHDLFIMDIDGKNIESLEQDVYWDDPVFSPDGSKIAFASFMNDIHTQIYTINIKGHNKVKLTNNLSNMTPQYLPSGSEIVFASARDGNGQIYIMNEDGSNQRKLTNNNEYWNRHPKVSPDGSKVVFVTLSPPDTVTEDLRILGIATGNENRLTNLKAWSINHKLSPDGSKIAFRHRQDTSGTNLTIMNIDGSNPILLLQNAQIGQIEFTPDGHRIVFALNNNIHTMNLDGSHLINLTQVHQNENRQRRENVPKVSPDGLTILFQSSGDGHGNDFYTMNMDGGNLQHLVDLIHNDSNPVFQPN